MPRGYPSPEERALYFAFEDWRPTAVADLDIVSLVNMVNDSNATAEDTRSRNQNRDLEALGGEWPEEETQWFCFKEANLTALADKDDPEFIAAVLESGLSAEAQVPVFEDYTRGTMARNRHRTGIAPELHRAMRMRDCTLFGTRPGEQAGEPA